MTIFAAAFVYVLPEATELIDDHFMHVVWGRQLLYGRRPLIDTEALGMPLQAGLSAISEWLVGYRLLSEGVIVSAAFALAAVLTFVIARRAARSVWIGIAAAAAQVAVFPRTYSYPKLVVFAAAILLLWRYVDVPSKRRAALLGFATAVAFYLRHDHGAYVGVVGLVIVALRHLPDWRRAIAHVTVLGATCFLVISPYLAYIQRHAGLQTYTEGLFALAQREHQQNKFDSWPRWPFPALRDVVHWESRPNETATIGIRWNEASMDIERRIAARRYGIQVEQDSPIESGRFLLTDVSTANVLALLQDPAIEDTADVNRRTGTVPRQGLWIGPVHLLAGLDTPAASGAFLFYAFGGVLILTPFALIRTSTEAARSCERLKMLAVVLIGIVTCLGFLREPLAIRIPDAIVAPVVLAAWWTGRSVSHMRAMGVAQRRLTAVAIAATVILLARSVVVIGAVPTRLERLTGILTVAHQLRESPPINANTISRNKAAAVRYIRSCTKHDDPLLVLWFAPDLYYYSERPFAGRLGFYMEGYWTSPDSELMNVAAIDRDRPTIALIESGREASDLYTYPHVLAYVADQYRLLGTLPSGDGRGIRVFARRDRMPSSIDTESGWPCYG